MTNPFKMPIMPIMPIMPALPRMLDCIDPSWRN
jgi:hypothetical protein